MREKTVIGIIGFGIVGKSVQHAFEEVADFRIYDTNPLIGQNTLLETLTDSQYIYVCVPTPMKKDTGAFDSSIIDGVVDTCSKYLSGTDKILIIKSTVTPETTKGYISKYPDMKTIFCPEFLTERFFLLDAINPSRIIFGVDYSQFPQTVEAEETPLEDLLDMYRDRFQGTMIFVTDPTTAEMVKYTSNCFFATKISFFNEIYQICEKIGIEYNDLIGMVMADGRIGNSHNKIPGHDGQLGFGGSCFPKDLNALMSKGKQLGIEPIVLEAVWKKNLEVRQNRDWESQKKAVS